MATTGSLMARVDLKRGHIEDKPTQLPKRQKRLTDVHEYSSEDDDEHEDDSVSTTFSQISSEDQVATAENTPLTPLSPASNRPREKSISQPPCRIPHLPCPYDSCNKFFNRRSRLEEHMRSHTNDRPFSCTYDPSTCKKTFLRQSHLTAHIKSAHTKSREFTCHFKLDPEDTHEKECGKAFATATKLRRHEKSHADGNARYRCTDHPPCKETFRKRATLAAHIKSVHLGIKPFVCEMLDTLGNPCGAGYDTAFKLRAHERRAHTDEAPHQCLICSSNGNGAEPTASRFRTQQELAQHTSICHPPICAECNTPFPTNALLASHQSTVHQSTNPQQLQPLESRRKHPCPYTSECTKVFTTASNLRVHIRTMHERSKPFVCGTTDLTGSKGLDEWDNTTQGCGAKFGVKASLEKHVRVRHLNLPDPGLVRKRQLEKIAQQGQNHSISETKVVESGTATELELELEMDTNQKISQLLGSSTGYNNRPVPCPIPECNYKFTREYDMQVHCKLYHTQNTSVSTDHEITTNIFQGFMKDAKDSNDNEHANNDNNTNDENDENEEEEESTLEHQALTGGPFWLGGLDESFDFTSATATTLSPNYNGNDNCNDNCNDNYNFENEDEDDISNNKNDANNENEKNEKSVVLDPLLFNNNSNSLE